MSLSTTSAGPLAAGSNLLATLAKQARLNSSPPLSSHRPRARTRSFQMPQPCGKHTVFLKVIPHHSHRFQQKLRLHWQSTLVALPARPTAETEPPPKKT